MTGEELPGDSHVVRYVKPRDLGKDGSPLCSAFLLRQTENGLSVHWLGCFKDLVKSQQLDEVRRLIRLTNITKGKFAELHVDRVKQHLEEVLDEVRFVHMPLDAEGDYEADPSHSEIVGLPPGDTYEGEMIGDMIAQCVEDTHLVHNN